MWIKSKTLAYVLLCLVLTGCCTSIGLREHIFHSQPAWESQGIAALTEAATKAEMKAEEQSGKKSTTETGGFENLVKQVLKRDISIVRFSTPEKGLLASKDPNPLPADVAANPVTKAIVLTIYLECKRMKVCDGTSEPEELPNQRLSTSDFKQLGLILANKSWFPNQSKTNSMLSLAGSESPKWQELFTAYLMEYYAGRYVDRYGTAYHKPKLDFAITNEVIVAFANIFQESLWDYFLISLQGTVKDPVVFEPGNRSSFINSTKAKPTLAKFLWAKLKSEDPIDGLVEPAATGNNKGLTQNEVCVVHHISGLSGEASEALTGMIIRALGGANLGFVAAYGKFSIGDHQTLAKLIDAVVETFSKRSSDLLFSHIFYNINNATVSTEINALGVSSAKVEAAKIDWEWLSEHVKLAELLACFEKKS